MRETRGARLRLAQLMDTDGILVLDTGRGYAIRGRLTDSPNGEVYVQIEFGPKAAAALRRELEAVK